MPRAAFKNRCAGKWETLTWDISALKNELGDVQRMLLFIEPAYKHLTGTVYIDNFKVLKTSQTDLTKEQPPVLGTPVYGSYDFYDANGDQEQGSIYRWYRADEKHGKFKLIKDAASRTYTPTEKDLGKFLKFEITPISDHAPNTGATVTSSATLKVTK